MIFANEVNLNKLKKTKNSNRNVGVFYVVPLGIIFTKLKNSIENQLFKTKKIFVNLNERYCSTICSTFYLIFFL